MSPELLVREFERLAEAPEAISRLREFLPGLALRGKLLPSGATDTTDEALTTERIARGMEMLLETRPTYRWTRGRSDPEIPTTAVPGGWRTTTLGDLGVYVNGIAFKPSDWGTGGRPIIRIQNLSGVSGDYNYTTRECAEDHLARAGDLLVSWSATLDAFIWDGPEGAVNQHIFKVVPNVEAVTRDFLYWLLKHEMRELARSRHAHGLAMMHINRGPFLSHTVLLPSLAEQGRVVVEINELVALCDQVAEAHVEREHRRAALRAASLQRLTASSAAEPVPQSAVRFFLTYSPRLVTKPEHVSDVRDTALELAVNGRFATDAAPGDRVRLGEVATLQNGYAFKSEWFAPSGVRLLRNVNVSHGVLRWREQVFLPEAKAHDFERFQLKPGDIVLSLDRPFISTGTKVARLESHDLPCLLLQRVGRLRIDPERIDPAYLYLWIGSPAFRRQIDPGRSNGVPHISSKQVEAAEIVIPSLGEQRQIVAKVDQVMALCDAYEAALVSRQSQRKRLLDALLAEMPTAGHIP